MWKAAVRRFENLFTPFNKKNLLVAITNEFFVQNLDVFSSHKISEEIGSTETVFDYMTVKWKPESSCLEHRKTSKVKLQIEVWNWFKKSF